MFVLINRAHMSIQILIARPVPKFEENYVRIRGCDDEPQWPTHGSGNQSDPMDSNADGSEKTIKLWVSYYMRTRYEHLEMQPNLESSVQANANSFYRFYD